ncbi:MAG: CHAP domain-containing protein [Cyanobacteria bacterium]|nr:CHAP domain-containing protein [Cyanobacteriota bacterium]
MGQNRPITFLTIANGNPSLIVNSQGNLADCSGANDIPLFPTCQNNPNNQYSLNSPGCAPNGLNPAFGNNRLAQSFSLMMSQMMMLMLMLKSMLEILTGQRADLFNPGTGDCQQQLQQGDMGNFGLYQNSNGCSGSFGRGSQGQNSGVQNSQSPSSWQLQPGQASGPRRSNIVNNAERYLGINQREHQDFINKRFCQGRQEYWCADFVSTILKESGGSPWGHRALCSDIFQWGRRNNRLTQTPKPGDAVIFNTRRKALGHIGLIKEIRPNGDIVTIEGNSGRKVATRVYRKGSHSYNNIAAFVNTDHQRTVA